MKPGQNWQNPIKPGGVVRKSWVFLSVGRMEGPWWRASVWLRRMGSLFTLAIRLIIKLSPLAHEAGHWWLWICACKHLKNSGHKVETNLSHRNSLLCSRPTAVSWVAPGRRESGNQHSQGTLSPSPLSMRWACVAATAVWINRRAKITLLCFYYNCIIYLKKVHTENEKIKRYLRAHNNLIVTHVKACTLWGWKDGSMAEWALT